MKILFSARFYTIYASYPSLKAKKYDERRNVWQARLTRGHRFYFRIAGDAYKILAITKHPK